MLKKIIFLTIFLGVSLYANASDVTLNEELSLSNLCDKLENECIKECEEISSDDKVIDICVSKCEIKYDRCMMQQNKEN